MIPGLPATGPARRALQATGQFWTPDWVAEAMAAFVLAGKPEAIFDPAVGAGAFFSACRRLGYSGRFYGYECDPKALQGARAAGLSARDLRNVIQGDFFQIADNALYSGIVSNPPYLRHHRIGDGMKLKLRAELRCSAGIQIDGRAGLHVYFLIWCLQRLAPNGKLAFILPADVCEGVFAEALWSWITHHYRVHALVTFAPEAAPFPGVDTNAFVVAIERAKAVQTLRWTRLESRDSKALRSVLIGSAGRKHSNAYRHRHITEALQTGFTRPRRVTTRNEIRLGDIAQTKRGIATGANEFFFLTRKQIQDRKFDEKWFIRAIGRTRDCLEEILDDAQLEKLEAAGRPTYLLNLPNRDPAKFPRALRDYLAEGERQGYPERSLIKSRKPWFRSEQRPPPPILFAYLGRRSCRFILNRAGVVPLTGFLCVYPRAGIHDEGLWQSLNDKQTLEGLAFVGKSYGSGAIKVEPRALERLPLPSAVCLRYGLEVSDRARQLRLLEMRGTYANNKARKVERMS